MSRQGMTHSTSSTNLADLLERVLDKGVVVAGDIKIKLVEIELLTIQIRLVICSVERAMQMGMDWWQRDPNLSSLAPAQPQGLPHARKGDSPDSLFGEPVRNAPVTAAPVAVPVAAPSDAVEQRLRDMESSLRRMEALLQAKNLDDPNPSR